MLNIGSIPIWMGYIIFATGVGFIALIGAILIVSAQEFITKLITERIKTFKKRRMEVRSREGYKQRIIKVIEDFGVIDGYNDTLELIEKIKEVEL